MRQAQSSTSLIQEAEQAKIKAARQEARLVPLRHAEIVEGLRRQMDGKIWWLERFTGKRPQHEVDTKRRELAVLVQACDLITGGGHGSSPS